MGARHLVSGYRAAGEWKHRRTSDEEEWNVGDYQTKAEDPARRGAHGRQNTTHSNALRPAGVNVGVEPHHDSRSVHWQYRGGYLSGIHQVVSASAHADRTPQLSEKSALWLPGDAVGKPPLHLETFVPLHPRVDRCEDVARSPRNCSGRGCETSARHVRDQAALLGHVDARSLFRQRLVERCGAQSDFVSYVAELTLADEIG